MDNIALGDVQYFVMRHMKWIKQFISVESDFQYFARSFILNITCRIKHGVSL